MVCHQWSKKRKITFRNLSAELFPARNKQRKKMQVMYQWFKWYRIKIYKTKPSKAFNAMPKVFWTCTLRLFQADLFQFFHKYGRVKIQLAFCLNHRKLIYLLYILHLTMVILISEDITNMCKFDFVIVKTIYKTNKHLVL